MSKKPLVLSSGEVKRIPNTESLLISSGVITDGTNCVTISSLANLCLHDLKDVNTSGASNHSVLCYDGSTWVPGSGGGDVSINKGKTNCFTATRNQTEFTLAESVCGDPIPFVNTVVQDDGYCVQGNILCIPAGLNAGDKLSVWGSISAIGTGTVKNTFTATCGQSCFGPITIPSGDSLVLANRVLQEGNYCVVGSNLCIPSGLDEGDTVTIWSLQSLGLTTKASFIATCGQTSFTLPVQPIGDPLAFVNRAFQETGYCVVGTTMCIPAGLNTGDKLVVWIPITSSGGTSGSYLCIDGSTPMTGDLNMAGHSICCVGDTSIVFANGNKILASKFDSSGNISADSLCGCTPSCFAPAGISCVACAGCAGNAGTVGGCTPSCFASTTHCHSWTDVCKVGSSLANLGDVTLSSPGTGCVLCWNGSTWCAGTAAGGGGGTTCLCGLTGDVCITSPVYGQILNYNGTKWINSKTICSSVNGDVGLAVIATGINENGIIVCAPGIGVTACGTQGSSGVWGKSATGYGVHGLSTSGGGILAASFCGIGLEAQGGCGCADICACGTGIIKATTFCGSATALCGCTPSCFAPAGISCVACAGSVTGVDFTGASTGNVLCYNGSCWIHGTSSGGTTCLCGLIGDVSITTPTGGQILSYNGSCWVNTTTINGVSGATGLCVVSTGTNGRGIYINATGTCNYGMYSWSDKDIGIRSGSQCFIGLTACGGCGCADICACGTGIIKASCFCGTATSVAGVNFDGASNKDILRYNGSCWVHGTNTYTQLGDVCLGTVNNGTLMMWSTGDGFWCQTQPTGFYYCNGQVHSCSTASGGSAFHGCNINGIGVTGCGCIGIEAWGCCIDLCAHHSGIICSTVCLNTSTVKSTCYFTGASQGTTGSFTAGSNTVCVCNGLIVSIT